MTSIGSNLLGLLPSVETARFKSLRAGLLRIECAYRGCVGPLPTRGWLAEIEGYLHCFAHELRFLEEYPMGALGRAQRRRLEILSGAALSVMHKVDLSSGGDASRDLQEALTDLYQSISKDFERFI